MAKTQYLVYGNSKWMGASGNALIALSNKAGSGKRIKITDVSIYNKTILGKTYVTDSTNPSSNRIKIMPVTGLTGGTSVTLVPMDSAAAAFPSTVNVKSGTNFVPTYIQSHPNSGSLVDSTVAVNDLTFTPDSAAAWVVNEHRDFERFLIVPSGGNAGSYRIISNTATALTLDRPFVSATATTGYIAEEKSYLYQGVIKQYVPTTANVGYVGMGSANGTDMPFGGLFTKGFQAAQEAITLRANESLAVGSPYVKGNIPLFLEGTIVVNGTPNRTYSFSFYTFMTSSMEALISIENTTGSGEVVRLTGLTITECGIYDTPYMQLVPINGIDSLAFVDPDKKIVPEPYDSAYGTLSTSVCEVFTNVPVLPFGVPSSYLSDGSAGSPKGFNYLNTKDFIGPVYATFFPEQTAWKWKEAGAGYYTNLLPGNFGAHLSDTLSNIKGIFNPIIIREGEGIAIVSGAETATITTAIGISGWGAYDFSLTLIVENATTPYLTLTGLISGTEVRVLDAGTQTELAGQENVTSGTFSWQYDQDVYTSVDIHVHHLNYQFLRLAAVSLTNEGVTIPVQQILDRTYSNP